MFAADDLIEEALKFAGGEQSTADDVLSARRSLYLVMTQWSARWPQSFRVGRSWIDVLPAVPGIPLLDPEGIDEIVDIVVSAKVGGAVAADIFVPVANRLSASEYAKISNKLDDGPPSSYYLERSEPPVLFLHPTGAGRSCTIWSHQLPRDFDQDRNVLDAPRRWGRALTLAVALDVSGKRPWPADAALMNSQQARLQTLERWAKEALADAQPADRERTPYRVRLA